MKQVLKNFLKGIGYYVTKRNIFERTFDEIWLKYQTYTMIKENTFKENLRLVSQIPLSLEGDIVECGVWRGGMIAAIAEIQGVTRKYFLFDSFEGLPVAKEVDGKAAIAWQNNTKADGYYNNCKAEVHFAQEVMAITECRFELVKGWFSNTLPTFAATKKIAILRLDGDWYDSTMACLLHLFPLVTTGGLVIIDDYYTWDGCTKAVHDYLSQNKLAEKIYTSKEGVCYILKL